MEEDWYVYAAGVQRGPLSLSAVQEAATAVGPDRMFVWRPGFEKWQIATSVPEVMERVRPISRPELPLVAVRPAVDATPITGTKHLSRSRPAKWAKGGIVLGLLLTGLRIALNPNSPRGAYDPWYWGGFAFAQAVMWALAGFVLALVVDFLTRPRAAAAPVAASEPAPSRSKNLVARHWRGELPLWVSYWVIGFVGSAFILATSIGLAAIANHGLGFYPPLIFAIICAIWLCFSAVPLWQIVGVWRSAKRTTARRHAENKSVTWSGLAQISVMIGALGVVSALATQGVPQIVSLYQIAFQDDPELPPYSIRVMRDGTEAEIVGGIKYGLTNDFEKILNASRRIKIVHLTSPGGRLGEGQALFELIRKRGLDTYVSARCYSACTLAFAGGRQRYLHKTASLGFHKGAFAGVSESNFDVSQRRIFLAAGFERSFVDRALSTPHEDMWTPSIDVLTEARVITGVSDGSQFAISGINTELDRAKISDELVNASPILGALRSRHPDKFESMVDGYIDGVAKGQTLQQIIDSARATMVPFINELIPLADDDVLVEYSRLMVDQYRALGAKNPTNCYSYGSGEKFTPNSSLGIPPDLLARERKLHERVLQTATKRPPIDQTQLEAVWTKVFERLETRNITPSDLDFLAETQLPPSLHRRYCDLSIAFFEEIGRLPRSDTGMLMRQILSER